jgi:hypothetical protein
METTGSEMVSFCPECLAIDGGGLHATKPKRNFNVISETTNSNIISKSNCE